jgi:serine/threonine protein kinase
MGPGKHQRPSSKTLQQVLKCDDEPFLDFLTRCLRWDPERRMKPDEAVQHEGITAIKPSIVPHRTSVKIKILVLIRHCLSDKSLHSTWKIHAPKFDNTNRIQAVFMHIVSKLGSLGSTENSFQAKDHPEAEGRDEVEVRRQVAERKEREKERKTESLGARAGLSVRFHRDRT